MAQTSTTLIANKGHTGDIGPGTDIRFRTSDNAIATTTTSLSALKQYDIITITGSTLNNKDFTVKSKATDNLSIVVEEVVALENAGATITINHTGFVSAKAKGDGYYSKPDGLHTVAYKVSAGYPASTMIKMQGTLASTPTESDWDNISGTDFTTDGTTIIKVVSFNFTGNYVYVRARATNVTGGTIETIYLNS